MTKAQARILVAIHTLTLEQGIPPTYREIGARLGIAHSAVHTAIKKLCTSGLVLENPRSARTVRLTSEGKSLLMSSMTQID